MPSLNFSHTKLPIKKGCMEFARVVDSRLKHIYIYLILFDLYLSFSELELQSTMQLTRKEAFDITFIKLKLGHMLY